MDSRSFVRYLLLPAYRPRSSLVAFLRDPDRVSYALSLVLFLGFLYTVTVVVGYSRGFGAVVPPALRIPAEEYYFWESLFVIPVLLMILIVFSGTARLMALAFGGSGSFEDILSTYGVALVFPTFLTMWIPESLMIIVFPDLRLEPLGGFGFMPVWLDFVRQLVGVIWPLAIVAIGLQVSERLAFWRAAVVTLVAGVPTAILMLVFIR